MLGQLYRGAIDAMNSVADRATVPLLLREGDLAGIQGTGTLFEIEGRHYIVTAQHVIAGMASLAVPVADHESIRWLAVDQTASNAHADVAVIRLGAPMVDELRGSRDFLTLDHVSFEPMPEGCQFLVYGYPKKAFRQDGLKIFSRPMGYLTLEHPGPIDPAFPYDPPYDPALEFMLEYGSRAKNLQTGETEEAPPPSGFEGVSGCSVWGIPDPAAPTADAIWSPRTAAKIVAIQVSVLRHEWIRCRRWCAVTKLIAELSPLAHIC
jgi:hypothetical protein